MGPDTGRVCLGDRPRQAAWSTARLWGVVLFTELGAWEGWGAGANQVEGVLGPPGVAVGS